MLDHVNDSKLVGGDKAGCEVKLTNQKHNLGKSSAEKERMEIQVLFWIIIVVTVGFLVFSL